MGKLTFVLGGARSGKSTFVLNLAKKYKKVAFIATGQALDREMKKRILLHKKARPIHWQTFEEDKEITSVLQKIGDNFDCVIIDCLTLWLSNLMLAGFNQDKIEEKISEALSMIKKIKGKVIIISNEVGLGIVPVNKLARRFRDIAGKANQIVCRKASEVFFMVSALAMKIKKGKRNG